MAPQIIYLHTIDGRTLWVPTHQPTPTDKGPVMMLPSLTPQELSRSFYLFENPVTIVEDARAVAGTPGGKTPSDVLAAIAQFRERCAKDEKFMMSNRYNPNRPPPAPVAPPAMPIPGFPPGMVRPPFGMYPTPPVPGAQPAAAAAANAAMAAAMNMGGYPHHMMHPGMPHMGGYGGAPGMPPPPPPHGMPGMMGHGGGMPGMMGPGGMMGGAPQQSRFNQVVVDKPQPVDIPIDIPQDVWGLYHQSGRVYLATLPMARITVWLRQHTMLPANAQRYVYCKGGVALMMKATAGELREWKPVELFDRQLCTHFLAHGYCSRSGCLHVHHSEQQLRHMIAAKHVLLQQTPQDQDALYQEIEEKERAAYNRPKEDFETRFAIVSSMPPTFVTGTPSELLKPQDPETAAKLEALQREQASRPPVSENGVMSASAANALTDSTAARRQVVPRFTGPIGVASDSDGDDSDSDSSSDSSDSNSDSDSDSSSSSSSDSSSSSESDDEEQKAKAERMKVLKKQKKKLIEKMKEERDMLIEHYKKGFKSISRDAEDELRDIKKKEKKNKAAKRERSEEATSAKTARVE